VRDVHVRTVAQFAGVTLVDMFDVDRRWMERVRADAALRQSCTMWTQRVQAHHTSTGAMLSNQYVQCELDARHNLEYSLEDALAATVRTRDASCVPRVAAHCKGIARALLCVFKQYYVHESPDVAALLREAKTGAEVYYALAFVSPHMSRPTDHDTLAALLDGGIERLMASSTTTSAMQQSAMAASLKAFLHMTWSQNVMYRLNTVYTTVDAPLPPHVHRSLTHLKRSPHCARVTALDAAYVANLKERWRNLVSVRHTLLTRFVASARDEVDSYHTQRSWCAKCLRRLFCFVRHRDTSQHRRRIAYITVRQDMDSDVATSMLDAS